MRTRDPIQAATAYPKTCERCRHEHVFGVNFAGQALERISGLCMQGKDWGRGCAQYAERALKR